MKAVIQRVSEASVTVENELVSEIQNGFLILLGVHQDDSKEDAEILAKKGYFPVYASGGYKKRKSAVLYPGGTAGTGSPAL